MLHAHYSAAADALPSLDLAVLQTGEPITVSATADGPWAETSGTTVASLSLPGTQNLPASESLYGADTIAIALALVGAWLVVMGGALIARRRVPVETTQSASEGA